MTVPDPDGGLLLSSPEVVDVLVAAIGDAGGRLLRWQMDHVDHQPGRGTTATYRAEVAWEWGQAV